jgi:GSH-dependent disulfide-bond oxidoreductase
MLELWFYPSPNGLKPLILLEEIGQPYARRFVDIRRGEQFDPAFLRISPNNRIPALVDLDTGQTVFESGAVLIYIAEQAGRFLPTVTAARFDCLQWLFWQVGGLGPMAGQAHHFRAFASEVVPYGIKRYTDECNRLYGVLERQLADRDYVAGDYSIADIAIWPWIVPHARQGQNLADFPRLADWFERIRKRPAVERAYAIGEDLHADPAAYKFLYGQTARSSKELP